jgi:hypothetical protein
MEARAVHAESHTATSIHFEKRVSVALHAPVLAVFVILSLILEFINGVSIVFDTTFQFQS